MEHLEPYQTTLLCPICDSAMSWAAHRTFTVRLINGWLVNSINVVPLRVSLRHLRSTTFRGSSEIQPYWNSSRTMHVGTKQSRLRTSTTRRSSNELTNLNFGKSELMQTRPSKLQALTVLLLNKSKIFVIAWMLDNTNNLSLNASWLLSPQAQRAIERLNSPFVADGTDHENRENILNRKTRENRINLIELNSSEEQDYQNTKVNSETTTIPLRLVTIVQTIGETE